jgi:hypothetical protein
MIRMGTHFFPEKGVSDIVSYFYEPDGRLARIA